MPVEIKELTIKAYVSESPGQKNEQVTDEKKLPDNIGPIVDACVEQVLEILKNKEER